MDFSQISLFLATSALFGILVKRLKQPVLIGYILAGILLSLAGFIKNVKVITDFGKVGVALLLFLVGLEMNVRELKTIGKAALLTGLGQITFTFSLGILLGLLLGFNLLVSSYLAIAVTFSSTIIVVKLLSEKNALDSLYGKISVGFLLVQDFVAILILIFLSGTGWGRSQPFDYFFIFLKAVLLLGILWYISKKILPTLFEKYVASSQELLFIVSIAWALGLASLVAGPLGFTLEVGGFLAGLALSNLPEHLEIASKTRPLRDFFLTIFFLSLGANFVVPGVGRVIIPALAYSILVFLGNPVIVMTLMGLLRFKKRTSFLASVTVAQISEFSLIVVAMGASLGHLTHSHVALTVIVAAITMTSSTYLILGAEKIYSKIKGRLGIFERRNPSEIVYAKSEGLNDHVVLVGCLRTGSRLLPLFKKRNIPYVIVDFNPEIYKKLSAKNHPVILGDITDEDILNLTYLDRAKLVISTIDSPADNLVLLEYIRRLNKRPLSLFTSTSRSDALKLYQAGATYVVVPDMVAGDHIRNLLRLYGVKGEKLTKAGRSHFNRLMYS